MTLIRVMERCGSIAAACCLVIAGAQAQTVVFSNMSTIASNTGGQVNGANFGPQTFAAQFTATANLNVVDAKLVAVRLPSGGPTFDVWIAADASGSPGTFIEQIGFGLQATSLSGSVVTASSIATPISLTSGTKYWLVVTPTNAQTSFLWGGAGSSSVPIAFNSSATFNSGWTVTSDALQFQIDGAPAGGGPPPPTPVPPSLLLGLTGLAGAGLYQWRRKRQTREREGNASAA